MHSFKDVSEVRCSHSFSFPPCKDVFLQLLSVLIFIFTCGLFFGTGYESNLSILDFFVIDVISCPVLEVFPSASRYSSLLILCSNLLICILVSNFISWKLFQTREATVFIQDDFFTCDSCVNDLFEESLRGVPLFFVWISGKNSSSSPRYVIYFGWLFHP